MLELSRKVRPGFDARRRWHCALHFVAIPANSPANPFFRPRLPWFPYQFSFRNIQTYPGQDHGRLWHARQHADAIHLYGLSCSEQQTPSQYLQPFQNHIYTRADRRFPIRGPERIGNRPWPLALRLESRALRRHPPPHHHPSRRLHYKHSDRQHSILSIRRRTSHSPFHTGHPLDTHMPPHPLFQTHGSLRYAMPTHLCTQGQQIYRIRLL